MRGRDVGVTAVAVAAAFLALQGTPDVDIQLHWVVGEHPLPRDANLPVPLPLVTDLDGDGKNEVVLLADGGMTIRVLSVPAASGETLVDPWILHEAKVAPASHVPGERRAVAMAAGYLERQPTRFQDLSSNPSRHQYKRKQHIVIVREDWSVVCYDHKLTRLWKRALEHAGAPGDSASYVIDQVAITVTHSVRTLDDQGHPKGRGADGLVVVGASMRHRDGRFHHNRAGTNHDLRRAAEADGMDPLGVHVEAFVRGDQDSRDASEEIQMSQEERVRRAAEHFSLFALDGNSGAVRWEHRGHARNASTADDSRNDGGDHGGDHDGSGEHQGAENLGVDFGFPGGLGGDLFGGGSGSFEGLAAVAGTPGGGGGQRYRRSLLRHLPHAWSAPSDTRLEITILKRTDPGDAGGHADGSGGPNGGGGGERPPPGRRRSLFPAAGVALSGGGDGGGGAGRGGGGVVRVVLARTREGLEAIELSTGRPVSAVALPAAASGAGVYVDLNGDGVVDHVQAVGTRGGQGWGYLHSGVAMGHLSEQGFSSEAQLARRLPPCYALAVSGLPPREQLFNGSICHDTGALFDVQERLSKPPSRSGSRSRDVEVGATSPAVLQKLPAATTARSGGGRVAGMPNAGLGARSEVVFAVSNGVVSSYEDDGRLKWQDRRGPTWARDGNEDDPNSLGGYVVPFTLEVGRPSGGGGGVGAGYDGGSSAFPFHAEERILVVGKDKMCVYDQGGRLAGSTPLVVGPSQRPVVGDFDGDGLADVLVVGWGGGAAGYALSPDPGVRVLFVAVLALAAAMLVVAAVYVPPPSSSWPRRPSGARPRLAAAERRLPPGKTKRATD